ncbi:hypothetical protein BDY19DRAFT_903077 [Irpex rosettiformis]|uniref:Uncharacterized protein n=1 Tax=Irpex rosettiformis TaxID=378272 RepID=A0ACB8UGC0_9APHY|nr:hypothetical protein BDY19DRAFT_903077 [Irpex rosettiformis]
MFSFGASKIIQQAANPVTQTAVPDDHFLKIHFLVVGGSLAGYASALSLCRAGHSVTVLDVEDKVETAWGNYGASVSPNLYRLLVQWEMVDELRKHGTKANRMHIVDYYTGESLGFHNWEEELLRDSGGDLVYCQLVDLKKMLLDKAVFYGAEIRHDVEVSGISVQKGSRPSARLTSGEVIEADVILGADGPKSVIRWQVIGQELNETPLGTALFNVCVPSEKMREDPELAALLEAAHTTTIWTGKGYAAYTFTAGGEFTCYMYLPGTGTEDHWYQYIEPAALSKLMAPCVPVLQRLVEAANSISCFPLCEPPQVEPWVHPEGRVVLVGDAAHPFPRASTLGPAMNVGDAGMLGVLFSHLHFDSQIDTFLTAFETLRRDRTKKVLPIELTNVYHIIMPDGEQRQRRDAALRERRDAGLDVFTGSDDDLAVTLWENDKFVFSYDVEEAAEEWWNDWGILDERANDAVRLAAVQIPIVQIAKQVERPL